MGPWVWSAKTTSTGRFILKSASGRPFRPFGNKHFSTRYHIQGCFYVLIIPGIRQHSEDNQEFSIKIQFNRSKKEVIEFSDLTTPEKIFFILTFFIIIQVHLNAEWIIFSNLFIESKYNKRGSIFRTIKKILPLFESDLRLNKHNLLFILSNLEMKEEIENLNIINI